AELRVKALSRTVTAPPTSFSIPPPALLAELPVNVVPVTVARPEPLTVTGIAPAELWSPPPLPAELPANVLSVTAAVPLLSSPPPSPAELRVKVQSRTVTVPTG